MTSKTKVARFICPVCGKSFQAKEKNGRFYLRKHDRIFYEYEFGTGKVIGSRRYPCAGSEMEM